MIDIIGNIVLKDETRIIYKVVSERSILDNIDFKYLSININENKFHGEVMLSEIENMRSSYFLNFEEDHFCVCQDKEAFKKLILFCTLHRVDVIRASFHGIEMACANQVKDIIFENDIVKIFKMTPQNFVEFQKPYPRFYLGTNSIFKKQYAKKIFSRVQAKRPHDYELPTYNAEYEYICAVPKFEILRSIDDDHGLPNSCLLKNPTPQFTKFMNE